VACSFKSIRFLLTDTQIPRDTKTLVAGVAAKKASDPEYINGLLQEIQHVADQAVIALDSDNLSRREQIGRLEKLVDRNHELLSMLGVSHAALEAIKIKAAQSPYGLHTKLTGAGGGGCAVTVVPDGTLLFRYH
jgi:mevalonate kinase